MKVIESRPGSLFSAFVLPPRIVTVSLLLSLAAVAPVKACGLPGLSFGPKGIAIVLGLAACAIAALVMVVAMSWVLVHGITSMFMGGIGGGRRPEAVLPSASPVMEAAGKKNPESGAVEQAAVLSSRKNRRLPGFLAFAFSMGLTLWITYSVVGWHLWSSAPGSVLLTMAVGMDVLFRVLWG